MTDAIHSFFGANWGWIIPGLFLLWIVLEWVVARQQRRDYQLWLDSLNEEQRDEHFATERKRSRRQAAVARKQRLKREADQRQWHDYMIYSGDYDPHD